MISTTLEYRGWIVAIVSRKLEAGQGGARIEAIARLHWSKVHSSGVEPTEGERNFRLAYGVSGLFSSEIRAQKAAFEAAKHGIDLLNYEIPFS